MVTLRQNNIHNSGNGRTFTITGGANGSQAFVEFTVYHRYGYVRKMYYCYNGGGNWTVVENESATNGAAVPTVTVTDGVSTATIVIASPAGSPSAFGGGTMITNFDSAFVSFA